jgi:hypothetical protein
MVAEIVAVPACSPVTTPVSLTVATWSLSVDQVTVRPTISRPAASYAVTDSCTVLFLRRNTVDGATIT